MAIYQFFEHWQNNGYDQRCDVAILVDGIISQICTIYATSNFQNKPFVKGETIEATLQSVRDLNTPPDGTVCLCGATEHEHWQSAACGDESHVEQVDLDRVLYLASIAKRNNPANALFAAVRTATQES